VRNLRIAFDPIILEKLGNETSRSGVDALAFAQPLSVRDANSRRIVARTVSVDFWGYGRRI